MRIEDAQEIESADAGPQKSLIRRPKFSNTAGEESGDSAGQEGKSRSSGGGGRSEISPTVFIMAMGVAIIFDAAGAFFNLVLPGLGGILSTLVITPIGFGILFLLYGASGKKFSTKSIAVAGVCFAIECIPILNALPGLTASVVASKFSEVAEAKIDSISGKK